MTAIDELRRLLDERGVEHWDHYFNTSWIVGGTLHMASEQLDGMLAVDKLTPEQAIAATLGSESVDYMLNTIGKLEEENERLRSSCGAKVVKVISDENKDR